MGRKGHEGYEDERFRPKIDKKGPFYSAASANWPDRFPLSTLGLPTPQACRIKSPKLNAAPCKTIRFKISI